jgi:hypothetical protein
MRALAIDACGSNMLIVNRERPVGVVASAPPSAGLKRNRLHTNHLLILNREQVSPNCIYMAADGAAHYANIDLD